MVAKMLLFNFVILLLLYWPCARAIENDHVIDQLATASEKIAVSLSKNDSLKVSSTLLSSSTEPNDVTVHYENSNGFVPMISGHQGSSSDIAEFHENSTSSQSDRQSDSSNSPNNDMYSTEAPLLLNIPQPSADRRSFDPSSGQKEFEILKVKDKTPAIANYHEFYQNLQTKINGNSQPNEGDPNGAHFRTRDRIKQIDDYLSYKSDKYHTTSNPYAQYYSHGNSRETQKKPTFEPEKVRSNYHHHGAPDYDIFGESVTRQRTTGLTSTNYDGIDNSKTNHNKQSSLIKQRHSTPVIVVEPSDYKVNVHYGTHQSSATTKITSGDSHKYEKEESEDRYDRNDDYTDDGSDYYEITERPRKLHKSRRKPYSSDISKKLPKEHRGSSNNSDELKKANASNKIKSNRGRVKPSQWNNEDHNQNQDESSELDDKTGRPKETTKGNDETQQYTNGNPNSWSQVTPNLEFSQSNGYELSQIDKPNLLVPVNLNLVPLSNFGQSTALGSSQGFGMPMVSTASPLISSHQPIIMTPQGSGKNHHSIQNGNYGYSTAVPDIIVGQNSFQNPVQTVFLPQQVHNKYNPNVKTYFSSTSTPMFAVNPTTASPKTNLITPHMTIPQLYYPQSTLQPMVQTPIHGPTNYNILVNPHGLHGQNIQTTTVSSNNNGPTNTADSQPKKNTFTGSNGQFLASASFSVGHGAQTQNSHTNDNKYYVPANVYPVLRNDNSAGKIKTYIPAQMVPAFFQTAPMSGVNMMNQHQGQGIEQQQNPYANRIQYHNIYAGRDSLSSTSNNNANTANVIQTVNGRAQLPVVGMQTVEIQNPNINIKPSPVDVTGINQFGTINHYPGAVLTTPIPIFSTAASFITPRAVVASTGLEPISIQSYVDSLTQIGAQNNQATVRAQNQPSYNPMNFVPNVDLINSQSFLNGKTDPLPPNLDLVPVVPGGKFYKHSPVAQAELVNKPKLSSDLEKYAEEMFKESVRTIYNTHKWNSDKRYKDHGSADIIDLDRLKGELDRIKASKYGKEPLEAHHSETKFHAVEPSKRPGLSVAALEELFKSNFKLNSDTQTIRPGIGEVTKLNDYLTPPRINSFVSKSKFVDKPVNKKRPSKVRQHSRPSSHTSHSSRPAGPEASASNHVSYAYRRPRYHRNHYADYKATKNYDNYPTFTTSTPDDIFSHNSKNDNFDFNHPRTHNLLGLLMKNKQLPTGSSASTSNFFREEDDYKQYLDSDQRRIHAETMENRMIPLLQNYH